MFLMFGLLLVTATGCVSQAEYDKLAGENVINEAKVVRLEADVKMGEALVDDKQRTIDGLTRTVANFDHEDSKNYCEEENLALRGSLEVARASYLARFDSVTICRYYGTGDHEELPVITKMYGGDEVDCNAYMPTTSDGYEFSETYFIVNHSVETGKSTLIAPYETD
jgi:outer membrane murein-binding lipoprotein Lpp